MKKLTLFTAIIILLSGSQALCADVPMKWDSAGTGVTYKIQMSTDSGATWAAERVVPTANGTTFTWLGAPETGLVLFRAVSVNTQGLVIRTDAGAWYNKTWKLPTPVGGLGTN